MYISSIKSIIGIAFPIIVFILTILGLVWLSDYITVFGATALGIGLVLSARYL